MNGEREYSEESQSSPLSQLVINNIDRAINVGGPPIPEFKKLQATGCTAGDIDFYNQVERSVECAVAGGTGLGPVGQLVEISGLPPVSCMMDLITGPYWNCDESEIPSDRRKAAYDNFVDITGYKSMDWNDALNEMNVQQKEIIKFNAFYIFFPVFILSVIVIWIMVGFEWINWVVGLFLTILVFIIFYGFSMLYRVHAYDFINKHNHQLQKNVGTAQQNFENSIAYWPQGLFAVACTVTGTGNTGAWICTDDDLTANCENCPRISESEVPPKSRRVNRGPLVHGDIKNDRQSEKLVKKRRVLRNRKK